MVGAPNSMDQMQMEIEEGYCKGKLSQDAATRLDRLAQAHVDDIRLPCRRIACGGAAPQQFYSTW